MEKQTLKLISPIPPSVNHYLAYRAIIKNGKPMAMSYKTSEAVKYQKDFTKYVIDEVKKQSWERGSNKFQHYYIDVVFYFPRIDVDANNYFKCILDSITDADCVWFDDNQTCERVNRIYYNSKNPRMELNITKVDYIGVFDSASQLDEFKNNNCVGCNKYTRNCSLLNAALEGRVQEEFCNGICLKKK